MQAIKREIYQDLSKKEQELKSAVKKLNCIVQSEFELKKIGGDSNGER